MPEPDLVVVGGGIMGCAVAWRAAREGAQVVLLEADRLGSGSSSRGAGGFRHQFPEAIDARLSRESIAFYAAAADELGEPVPFWQHGYLFLGRTGDELDALEQRGATAQALGAPIERLSVERVLELVPGLRVDDLAGGVLGAADGYGDPSATVQVFARAASTAGADLREGVAVERAERDGERLRAIVGADGSRFAPAAVVIAAGAWSGRVGLLFGLDLRVRPLRRQLVFSEPIPALPARLPMTIEAWSGFHFRPHGEGVLLASADGVPCWDFSLEPDPEPIPRVVAQARSRYPLFATVRFPRARAGLYEVTPDTHPLIGRHPALPAVVCCCGFSGHGFMQAPAASRAATAVALGQAVDVDLSPYAPDRFDGAGPLPDPVLL